MRSSKLEMRITHWSALKRKQNVQTKLTALNINQIGSDDFLGWGSDFFSCGRGLERQWKQAGLTAKNQKKNKLSTA